MIHTTPKVNWFNANTAAKRYQKRPIDWLRLPETKRHLHALYKKYEVSRTALIETRKMNTSHFPRGTWLHPILALPFARWLDINFSAWCDEQLDIMLRGQEANPVLREAAALANFRVMNTVLNTPLSHLTTPSKTPYIGKERLINWAINGRFCQLDRDALAPKELAILSQLETRNLLLLENDENKLVRSRKLSALADELYEEPKTAKQAVAA